ncbi:hypothetical protein [Streptomyces sp. NPDC000410]|uniref:hypothetical protein n=1 Tax=Streptomyces sp. NPDC000410 TaxID=3154254 RepID=UPI00332C0B21
MTTHTAAIRPWGVRGCPSAAVRPGRGAPHAGRPARSLPAHGCPRVTARPCGGAGGRRAHLSAAVGGRPGGADTGVGDMPVFVPKENHREEHQP